MHESNIKCTTLPCNAFNRPYTILACRFPTSYSKLHSQSRFRVSGPPHAWTSVALPCSACSEKKCFQHGSAYNWGEHRVFYHQEDGRLSVRLFTGLLVGSSVDRINSELPFWEFAYAVAVERSRNRLCRKTRSGFERPFFRLATSGCIDDKTNIACFAVFARRKNCSLSGQRRSFPTEPNTQDKKQIRTRVSQSDAQRQVF